MRQTKLIILTWSLIGLTLACSCTKHSKQLNLKDYVAFVEDADNGLRVAKVIGPWSYTVQLKPYEYIYSKERRMNATQKELEARKAGMKGWIFFNVYVSNKAKKGQPPIREISENYDEYNRNNSYLLTENGANFSLSMGDKSYQPVIYTYENNYNLSPEDVFTLGFNTGNSKLAESLVLEYNDILLKSGIIKFKFNSSNYNSLPQLTLEN